MILVEGCDNSGKSTLVRRLAEDCKLLSIANKRRPKAKDDAFAFLNSSIALSKRWPCIFDRWTPISEDVYGHVIRGHTLFNRHEFEVAMAAPVLAGINPLVVYCRPTASVIIGNLQDREQMAGVEENAYALITRYDQVIEHWTRSHLYPHEVVCYNYRDSGAYDQLKDRVLQYFKDRP